MARNIWREKMVGTGTFSRRYLIRPEDGWDGIQMIVCWCQNAKLEGLR